MKKKLYNIFLLRTLLGLIALSNCSDNKGNSGNHANTPPGAPDSEYPGNRSDSTSNAAHLDTMHHE